MLDLPTALLDRAAYPTPPREVEMRETHTAWVFLAGEKAYKVKKPVVLPFLDYGTAQRRRECCYEEVRVNQRLAPRVYLGVAGIAEVPGGRARIVAAHAPGVVEHAVVMRRYDEGRTLAAMVRSEAATAADLERIGRTIADFHGWALERRSSPGDWLGPVVDETLGTLAGLVGEPRVALLRRFLASALDSAMPQLQVRAARGLVRDGHGDLRAEHVLLTDPISVVDAVEFDPGLRQTDVGYDLGYLVMDLRRLDGRLVPPLLAGYRDAGGDPGGPALLALFTVVRALVRAKVDLLRAGQLTGAPARERRDRGLELLALAEREAWQVRLPPVLCVAGLAASGKSTFAATLARASGRPVLSSDVVRKRLAGVPVDRPAGAGAYTAPADTKVYGALGREAAACARAGSPVIVDATFRHGRDVAVFCAACPAHKGWVVCRAYERALLERARRRAGRPEHGSDAGEMVVRRQLDETGGVLALPTVPLATLDTTTASPEELLASLAHDLDAVAPAAAGRRER